jgi:phenylalanyl-tRNA synthetase alpha chain
MLHELEEKLRESLREFRDKVEQLKSESDLNDLKGRLIGKKGGRVTEVLAAFGKLTPEERAKIGQLANTVKQEIEAGLKARLQHLKQAKPAGEFIDLTLDPEPAPWGARHPITRVRQDIEEFFIAQGYAVVEGPEIETDFYNFAALNFPDDHPARDMQDTIFVDLPAHPTEGPWVLRTHTSPVQIRTMVNEKRERPDPDFSAGGVLKIICPGKVYRHDDDLTHSPMFHQIEGLCVGPAISLSHLKGTLLSFIRHVFGKQAQIRLRPSFFPFVEPGVEVDMSCTMCAGKGCRSCKQTGFMEILGAGMVHPNLFRAVAEKRRSLGLPPLYYDFTEHRATVTGFAFGTGLDRIAMLRYGIPNIKLLFSGDLRFLTQFREL